MIQVMFIWQNVYLFNMLQIKHTIVCLRVHVYNIIHRMYHRYNDVIPNSTYYDVKGNIFSEKDV